MTATLAQAGIAHTIGWWAILLIVILAVLGICYAIAQASGIPIPPWLRTVIMIVIAACVGIVAVKLVLSFL